MLKGDNIYISAVELSDARLISSWLNDNETNRNLDIIYPLSKSYADSFVVDAESDYNKKVFMIYSPNMNPIGLAVIDKIKWEYRNLEIGIVIYDKKERNKGYGHDALRTMVKFIFDEMNMHLIYLHVLIENILAINLYKSEGFIEDGVLRDRYFKAGEYKSLLVMSKTNERV